MIQHLKIINWKLFIYFIIVFEIQIHIIINLLLLSSFILVLIQHHYHIYLFF